MILKLLKYYFSLLYWEKASVEKVKKMQLKKFSEIFEYAKKHSKFYQDIYTKNGVMDLKIKTWEDLKKVPIIDKYHMRKWDIKDIVTVPITDKINLHTTSGSSGEPMKFYFDRYTDYTAHVRVFYVLRKVAHYTPFKKITLITRYEENENFGIENDLSLIKKIQRNFGLFQRDIISIYRDPDFIIQKIKESNPYILWSTPSILEIVVNRLIEMDISLKVPYLFFTSENLTPIQFNKFRKYISQNIIDVYGSMESPCLGYEVNKSGKRLLYPNSNCLEIINKRESEIGEIGDVVITNLLNYTTPIIRYDLKDFSKVINDNEFPHKVSGEIIGRIDDMLDFPDGSKFVHHHAYSMFMDFEECETYKFVQKNGEPIKMFLKAKPGSTNEQVKEEAIRRWNIRFAKFPIEIEFVAKFEIDPKTGKFRNIERLL